MLSALLLVGNLWAAQSPVAQLHYDAVPKVSAREQTQIVRRLARLGFADYSVSLKPLREKFYLDQILAKDDLSQTVFVRFGVVPAKSQLGLVMDMGGGDFLVHIKAADGAIAAVYFSGFTKAALNPVLNAIQFDRAAASRWPAPSFSFLPEANAEESQAPRCHADKSFSEKAQRVWKAVWREGVWECLKGALGAAIDVPGYVVFGVFDGSVWAGLKQTWRAIKSMREGFFKSIADHYEGYFSLPSQQQARIFCEFAGVAVGTAGTAFFSGGSTLAAGFVAANSIMKTLEVDSEVSAALKRVRCQKKEPEKTLEESPSDAVPSG